MKPSPAIDDIPPTIAEYLKARAETDPPEDNATAATAVTPSPATTRHLMAQARELLPEEKRSQPPRWVIWKDLSKYRRWHAFLQDPYLNEAREAGIDPYILDLRRKKDVLAEIEIRDAQITGRNP